MRACEDAASLQFRISTVGLGLGLRLGLVLSKNVNKKL